MLMSRGVDMNHHMLDIGKILLQAVVELLCDIVGFNEAHVTL